MPFRRGVNRAGRCLPSGGGGGVVPGGDRGALMRVGIEVGGTFTDLVAVDGSRVSIVKVPSTPASPDEGAVAALEAAGIDPAGITDLVHGSTVATNAILERK